MNTYMEGGDECYGGDDKKQDRLTVGVTSAAIASRSQMTPLRTEIHQHSQVESPVIRKKSSIPTWFHSRCPKTIVPPPWQRRQKRPKSMIRSKPISVTSATIVLSLMDSILSSPQVSWSAAHAERSCRIHQLGLKMTDMDYPPDRCLVRRSVKMGLSIICRRGLPWKQGLTLDEERDVGHPHCRGHSHNNSVPVPNSDSNDTNQLRRLSW
jgi:hypothetical protein